MHCQLTPSSGETITGISSFHLTTNKSPNRIRIRRNTSPRSLVVETSKMRHRKLWMSASSETVNYTSASSFHRIMKSMPLRCISNIPNGFKWLWACEHMFLSPKWTPRRASQEWFVARREYRRLEFQIDS